MSILLPLASAKLPCSAGWFMLLWNRSQ